nr:DUF2478 domain-containing protein [uncultured Celeribacter sp.]
MLGYVVMDGRGETDRLLREVAHRLTREGCRLIGAVQINEDIAGQTRCQMDLELLPCGDRIRISQSLGAQSKGCRLDAEGLETAVAATERALEQGGDLVLLNKFGKQELSGRGFRDVVGTALMQGVPVLLGVNQKNLDGFLNFAQDVAIEVSPTVEAVCAWCEKNFEDCL